MSPVATLALAHLRLVWVALTVATALGIGVGLVSSRRPALARVLLGASSLVQTIPAIALLAVMVPTLAWVASTTGWAIPSIGELPALLALSAYALLPIVRGVVLGLGGIDPAVRRSALAVGMTETQSLREVELPLAAPAILGGMRTAAVWTVGMATLATPVGGASLGNLIFQGLQTRHFADVLVGCGAAATLAIVLDQSLAHAEASARGRHAMRSLVRVLGVLALGAVVALATTLARGGDAARPISVGAKSFTEQLVLAEILRCSLEHTISGREPVEIRPSLGTTIAFDALAAGDLDVYVEYTGTAWTTILGHTEPADRTTIAREVAASLTARHDVRVAARLGFENAYAVVVRDDDPARSIAQLAPRSPLRVGGDYEIFGRDEWRGLVTAYGLSSSETVPMDPSLMYEAVRARSVDAILGYTTDGRIDAMGLRVLDDERGALPPYDALVLVSGRFARERPDLLRALAALEGTIDAATMRRWNAAVDADGRSPADVAREHAACRGP